MKKYYFYWSKILALCVTSLAVFLGATQLQADISSLVNIEEAKQRFKRPQATPFPETNVFSPEKVMLGKQLFFDPRLSQQNNISCASCHNPGLGWEDGQAKGIGTMMTRLDRHSPTLLDLAWGEVFFWDGRTASLESQVIFPLTAGNEMGQNVDELIAELSAIPVYVAAFERVFPHRKISIVTISEAIATFERTIVSGISPFDRWIAGDKSAISEPAKRGFELFVGRGNCEVCHSGWNFTDNKFHDIGMVTDDLGRFNITGNEADRFAFKTPGLRNIAKRAPFMHDGSMGTMRMVLDHYNNEFVERPSLSSDMQKLDLQQQDIVDLFMFLLTLSSDNESVEYPELPPSVPR